jgi:hypothetical protein
MFARASDASKIAFTAAVRQLDEWRIGLIDCQVHTDHLERFGAYEVPRLDYLQMLARALDEPTKRGTWKLELDVDEFARTGGMMSFTDETPAQQPIRSAARSARGDS